MRIGRTRLTGIRRTWAFTAVALFCIGAAIIVRHLRYTHPSRNELAVEIEQRRAVIATEAEIKRDEPPLGGLIKSNSIFVVNPDVVRWMPPLGQKWILVIGEDEFFADDVRLAMKNEKELDSDWYATMGSGVRVVELSPVGAPKVLDYGYVTFIEVRFNGN
jgi:hypothetical protein